MQVRPEKSRLAFAQESAAIWVGKTKTRSGSSRAEAIFTATGLAFKSSWDGGSSPFMLDVGKQSLHEIRAGHLGFPGDRLDFERLNSGQLFQKG